MAEWTPAANRELIEGVYAGVITAFNLPEKLFEFSFSELMDQVDEGFKPEQTVLNKELIYKGFRKNINETAGAKTASNVIQLNEDVFLPDGSKRPFKDFSARATRINGQYNQIWLKTEQNTAFSSAQSADRWVRTQDQKETFPMLQYQTVNDGRVRPEHRDWDGIVKPVDDEFWNTRIPPNGWNCRCRVIRLRQAVETDLPDHRKKVNKERAGRGEPAVPNLKNSSDIFNINPAKSKYIFKESQTPYFADAARFTKQGKNNYGLGYK